MAVVEVATRTHLPRLLLRTGTVGGGGGTYGSSGPVKASSPSAGTSSEYGGWVMKVTSGFLLSASYAAASRLISSAGSLLATLHLASWWVGFCSP